MGPSLERHGINLVVRFKRGVGEVTLVGEPLHFATLATEIDLASLSYYKKVPAPLAEESLEASDNILACQTDASDLLLSSDSGGDVSLSWGTLRIVPVPGQTPKFLDFSQKAPLAIKYLKSPTLRFKIVYPLTGSLATQIWGVGLVRLTFKRT